MEKSLSKNSIESYIDDVSKLEMFFIEKVKKTDPRKVTSEELEKFIKHIAKSGIASTSQARIISGVR
ncbi:MAG: site-specific integrase, partial [Bacteroidota bacterium]